MKWQDAETEPARERPLIGSEERSIAMSSPADRADAIARASRPLASHREPTDGGSPARPGARRRRRRRPGPVRVGLRRCAARPRGCRTPWRSSSWGHGFGRWYADLTNVANRDRQAERVAETIRAFQAEHPGRPVFLVGKSGGAGIVVKALERLDEDSRRAGGPAGAGALAALRPVAGARRRPPGDGRLLVAARRGRSWGRHPHVRHDRPGQDRRRGAGRVSRAQARRAATRRGGRSTPSSARCAGAPDGRPAAISAATLGRISVVPPEIRRAAAWRIESADAGR